MRVLSVTLERFGALRGVFRLDPGLTVISGPNESGKSTLHTALRVALCGVDLPGRGRMPKETEELLRRYRPWRGESFRLEAELEVGQGRYRILRNLDRLDQSQVLDLVRGGDVTPQFRRGRQVDVAVPLGMSREAYLSVSSVAQDQLLELSGSSLQADLQRATSTSGSHATARAAIELLRSWRQANLRSDSSRSRPMDELQKQVDGIQRQLERAQQERERLGEALAQQEELRSLLAQAEGECQRAELRWRQSELQELEADLRFISDLDQQLTVEAPSLPVEAGRIRQAAAGAPELLAQLRQAEQRVAELAPKDQERARIATEVSVPELDFLARALDQRVPPLPAQADNTGRLELLDHRRIRFLRWSSDLLALLGAAGGGALVWKGATVPSGVSPAPYFLGGLAVLVVFFGGYLWLQSRLRGQLALAGFSTYGQMRRAARHRNPEVIQAMAAQEEVLAQRAKARQRLSELGIPEASSDSLRSIATELPRIQGSLQEAGSWQTTLDRARQELLSRGESCGIESRDPSEIVRQLTRLALAVEAADSQERRIQQLTQRREERLGGRQLREMVRRAEELRFELAGQLLDQTVGERAEQLRREYDRCRERREGIRSQLLPLEGGLQQQLREAGDVAGLEEQLAQRLGELERMSLADAAVKLAISELEAAEGEIHLSLAPVLAEGLEARLPGITAGRYRKAWVDPSDLSMHVAATEQGRQVSVDHLSQGTQEQIYVCLRMVLAKALSPKGEPLPLIFDDPSVNSDDRRCFALLDTLLQLSQTSQVVIFSHESRVAAWAQQRQVPMLVLSEVPAGTGSGQQA